VRLQVVDMLNKLGRTYSATSAKIHVTTFTIGHEQQVHTRFACTRIAIGTRQVLVSSRFLE